MDRHIPCLFFALFFSLTTMPPVVAAHRRRPLAPLPRRPSLEELAGVAAHARRRNHPRNPSLADVSPPRCVPPCRPATSHCVGAPSLPAASLEPSIVEQAAGVLATPSLSPYHLAQIPSRKPLCREAPNPTVATASFAIAGGARRSHRHPSPLPLLLPVTSPNRHVFSLNPLVAVPPEQHHCRPMPMPELPRCPPLRRDSFIRSSRPSTPPHHSIRFEPLPACSRRRLSPALRLVPSL